MDEPLFISYDHLYARKMLHKLSRIFLILSKLNKMKSVKIRVVLVNYQLC